MLKRLAEVEDFCLKTIDLGQMENGEFKTFLFFPGKEDNGWIYAGPSVFLTSSIAITLISERKIIASKITNRAAQYVLSQMEEKGLWRFYPHNGLFKFNTPLDVDDTSLASYLLQKLKIKFPCNKELLYKQITKSGNFYIWFLPRFKFVFTPLVFLRLLFDLRHSFPIFFALKGRTSAPLINYYDSEHAVNANAILYLGENSQTKKAINHLVEDILFGNSCNLYFYPSILYTYYHISRVYSELGIKQLENIKIKIENYFRKDCFEDILNIQDKAVAIVTLANFKIESNLKESLMTEVLAANLSEIAKPYPYFCTKDRAMVGGSIEYTCAIVLSAIRGYQGR